MATVKLEQVAVAIAAGIKVVLPIVKDGVQLKDGLELFQAIDTNEPLKQKFADAAKDIGLLDAEIKNLDFFGGLRVLRAFINEYKK